MDKKEYKIRLEQIKELLENRDYAGAKEVCDIIDWKRVKSVSTLCTVSEIYKINRDYEDARDILLLAYDRSPDSKNIVYALCELSLKLNDIVDSVNYRNEYEKLAPGSSAALILTYRIFEAQEVSIDERISVLEAYKKAEGCTEKWGYELALLYHRSGQGRKCAEECDELILTHAEGQYVRMALELKAMHRPLTALQQEQYDAILREEAELEASAGKQETAGEYADGEYYPEDGYANDGEYQDESYAGEDGYDEDGHAGDGHTGDGYAGDGDYHSEMERGGAYSGDESYPDDNRRDSRDDRDGMDGDVSGTAPEGGVAGDEISTDGDGSGDDIKIRQLNLDKRNSTINIQEELSRGVREFFESQGGDGGDDMLQLHSASEGETGDIDYYGETGGYDGSEVSGSGDADDAYPPEDSYAGEDGSYPQEGAYAEDAAGDDNSGSAYEDEGQDYGKNGRSQQDMADEYLREAYASPEMEEYPESETFFENAAYTGEIDQDTIEKKLGRPVKKDTDDIPQIRKLEKAADEAMVKAQTDHLPIIPKVKQVSGYDPDRAPAKERIHEEPASRKTSRVLGAGPAAGVARVIRPENKINRMLSQDNDGQISMVVPEPRKVEKQITGQMDISGYLSEWERQRKESQRKRIAAAKRKSLEQTNDIASQLEPVLPRITGELPSEEEIAKSVTLPEEDPEKTRKNMAEFKKKYTTGQLPQMSEMENAPDPDEYGSAVLSGQEKTQGPDGGDYGLQPSVPENEGFDMTGEAASMLPVSLAKEAVSGAGVSGADTADIEQAKDTYPDEYGIFGDDTYPGDDEPVGAVAYPGSDEPAPDSAYPGADNLAREPFYPQDQGYDEGYAPAGENYPQGESAVQSSYPGQDDHSGKSSYPGQDDYSGQGGYPAQEEYPAQDPYSGAYDQGSSYGYDEYPGVEEIPEIEKFDTSQIPGDDLGGYRPEDGQEPLMLESDEGYDTAGDYGYEEEVYDGGDMFTDEEYDRIFGEIVHEKKMKERIVKALPLCSMDPRYGNVVIYGNEKSSRIDLALGIAKSMKLSDPAFTGRPFKISAEDLNSKDILKLMPSVAGGALVIEDAWQITVNTLDTLAKTVNHPDMFIIIIMETDKKYLKKLSQLRSYFDKMFDVKIEMTTLSNNDLVEYAKKYARDREYVIDEMGVLALHRRIDELQTATHNVTKAEVDAIMDEAFADVDRKNFGLVKDILFSRRYDKDDLIILREKNFEKKKK